MDTKLKKYRYSVWFKSLAIVLCVAGIVAVAYGITKAPHFEVALQNTDFKESNELKKILGTAYWQVSNVAFNYKSEEYIKSNDIPDENYIRDKKNQIIDNRENEIIEINDKYNSLIQQHSSDNTAIADSYMDDTGNPDISYASQSQENYPDSTEANRQASENDNKLLTTLVQEREKEIQDAIKKYDEAIKNIKTNYIDERISEYYKEAANLKKLDGIYYTVIENGKVTYSNIQGASAESSEVFYGQFASYIKLTPDNIASVYPINYYYDTSNFPQNAVIYLGMSQTRFDSELSAYNTNFKEGRIGIASSAAGFLAFLISLIYLIYASGRRVDKDGIHLIFADYIHLDAALAISATAIILCIVQAAYFYMNFIAGNTYFNKILLFAGFAAIVSIGTLIGILFVTMLSKRAKRHEVLKHTLIYKITVWCISKVKKSYSIISSKISSVYDTSPPAIRLILAFGAYALLTIISIFLFLTGYAGAFIGFVGIIGINLAAVYFLLKNFKVFKDIHNGAEKIRSGELSYNIPEEGIPEFKQLSSTINGIADGLKAAVSSQVKSERMKAELITNVSHDLKTPLTSIITYVDLLKKEGLQSENAEKYLDIIDNKSQRLKSLTEDLFEAAKASSGSIAVNLEKLDIVSLINQGLGELSDKIEISGLSFRINLPSSKLFVNADGKLLWRVIENLLSNVFKYALPKSRVYIDAFSSSENVGIVIKNISAYELNINEDELMERFKRGDASRHSEGSGLGLSIAKSLTELQGGSFHIEIDGDLFKAVIELPGISLD